MSLFQKASKQAAKAKVWVDGVSGGGKTQTMLRILLGIGQYIRETEGREPKIAVIDSENHSVEKKSAILLGGIDVANIEDRTIDNYVRFIKGAEEEGYDCLGVDSLTHPWLELLESVEKLAKTKYAGNTFRAWAEGTPKQRKLIDALVFSKMHVVATGRVKTEWATELSDKGKVQPRKVGLQAEQGKGIEYEFDICMRLNEDHYATIYKDRFDAGLQDLIIEKPGEDFGVKLMKIVTLGDPAELEISSWFERCAMTATQRQAVRDKYPDKAVLITKLKEYAAAKRAAASTELQPNEQQS
jgi:hypothetical protein